MELNRVLCMNNMECHKVCTQKGCNNNPFMCRNNDCQCHQQHINCQQSRKWEHLIGKINSRLKVKELDIQNVFCKIEKIFANLNKQIDVKSHNFNIYRKGIGLTKAQKQFVETLNQANYQNKFVGNDLFKLYNRFNKERRVVLKEPKQVESKINDIQKVSKIMLKNIEKLYTFQTLIPEEQYQQEENEIRQDNKLNKRNLVTDIILDLGGWNSEITKLIKFLQSGGLENHLTLLKTQLKQNLHTIQEENKTKFNQMESQIKKCIDTNVIDLKNQIKNQKQQAFKKLNIQIEGSLQKSKQQLDADIKIELAKYHEQNKLLNNAMSLQINKQKQELSQLNEKINLQNQKLIKFMLQENIFKNGTLIESIQTYPIPPDFQQNIKELSELKHLKIQSKYFGKEQLHKLESFKNLFSLNLESSIISKTGSFDLAKMLPNLQYLNISNNNTIQKEAYIQISKLQNLKVFQGRNNNITEQIVSQFANNSENLEILNLQNNKKIRSSKCFKQGFNNLKTLNLNNNDLYDNFFEDLIPNQSLSKFIRLYINNNNITNVGIHQIKIKLPKLKELQIANNRLNHKGCYEIANLQDMHKLDVSQNKLNNDEIELIKLILIQAIKLNQLNEYKQKQQIEQLKIKYLKDNILPLNNQTIDEDFANIITRKLHPFTKFNLNNSKFKTNQIIFIANRLTNIVSLSLQNVKLQKQAISVISQKLIKIKNLNVSHCSLQPQSAINICKMISLQQLKIDNNELGLEITLKIINSLINLKTLIIYNNKIEKFDQVIQNIIQSKFINIETLHLQQSLILQTKNNRINSDLNILDLSLRSNNCYQITSEQFGLLTPQLTHITHLNLSQNLNDFKMIKHLNNFVNMEKLNLSKTKLQTSAIEPLCDILKVFKKLKLLNLSQNNLKSDDIKKISSAVNKQLDELDLSKNKVSRQCVIQIINNLKNLSTFKIRQNNIQKYYYDAITNLVLLRLKNITTFQITNQQVKINPKQGYNASIRKISICNQKLNSEEIQFISRNFNQFDFYQLNSTQLKYQQVLAIAQIANIEKLSLNDNFIKDVGCKFITSHRINLTELYLNGNQISNQGAISIAINLSKLKKLTLDNNSIKDLGVVEISQKLLNLQHLSLQKNVLTNKSAQTISQNLLMLKYLDLQSNSIQAQGAIAIGNNLKKLQYLNLSNNKIEEQGAKYIGKKLSNLKIIKLNKCGIGNDGVKQITKNIRHLSHLYLQENQFGDEGAIAISKNLSELIQLNVNKNRLSDHGAIALVNMPNLVKIGLKQCLISEECKRKMNI